MKTLLALVLITLLPCIPLAHGEVTPEKRQEIEKMLKLTGTEKLMTQMMNQMIAGLKAQSPEVSEEFWTKFQKKLDTHGLIDQLIPIYDKYYTIDDLKAVNAFYESPAGQKVLTVLPSLMQESMKVGQEWGTKIAADALDEIRQEKKK